MHHGTMNIFLGCILIWFLRENPSWFSSIIVLPVVTAFCYVALSGLSSFIMDDAEEPFLIDLENIKEMNGPNVCMVYEKTNVKEVRGETF